MSKHRMAKSPLILLRFQIKVPKNLSTKGTFWSVVMLEGVQKIGKEATANDLQIKTQIRYAVQLITHIGGNFNKDLKIADVKLTTIKTMPHAVIDVENTADTLEVSLGQDKNIIVKREKAEELDWHYWSLDNTSPYLNEEKQYLVGSNLLDCP